MSAAITAEDPSDAVANTTAAINDFEFFILLPRIEAAANAALVNKDRGTSSYQSGWAKRDGGVARAPNIRMSACVT
jgi:hypothetical protein